MTTPTEEKKFDDDQKLKLPRPFLMRRLHSLLGLFLVLFLFEHLLVNSQASLFFQDDGYSFVRMVNKIHDIPYLKVVEILFLALPFLVHGLWGIHYAVTGRANSFGSGKKKPTLAQYKRNRAYTWQRWTSWILLIGISLHVYQMRFLYYPDVRTEGDQQFYTVQVENDPHLTTLAESFGATILNEGPKVSIEAPSAGVAIFLTVRNTFKSPLMVILYTILVIAASYHAFNGLWTAMITWGIACTRRSQIRLRILTTLLMWVVMVLGLMACWGPYWTQVWS
ncbi:MAG: Succinate dehydrogenase cytochrome b558 subunit [Chlamydiales bacterium]|nr:Succinate dehydrogenase cytochrome b558 subunit [Chlamydiales bacterium]MCH9635673.1 Succinate dehydrogenase cytochrome b558 subunit [Chlamydiales bacterium]MCH9703556.1 succinate dehydrogenase [Chlamydiota bacterium]